MFNEIKRHTFNMYFKMIYIFSTRPSGVMNNFDFCGELTFRIAVAYVLRLVTRNYITHIILIHEICQKITFISCR